ncbi:MAG TPA: TauD/TfdA family dioxygenase, partial [Arenicellales bacterium]|nr:TauD/TfdA family dioxygenase [Arenicellales bacterium]
MVSQLSESTALFSADVSTDCLARRLDDYRAVIALPPVDIADPAALNHQELAKLRERVAVANFAHYRCAQTVNDTAVLALCRQVGLKNLHQSDVTAGLNRIEVSYGSKARYIPYTNSELNWHTDGYYYPENYPVRAMLLHCVRPALEGGATELINHEIIYALLAQTNPDYVAALSRADVMTIPANIQAPDGPRQAQSG